MSAAKNASNALSNSPGVVAWSSVVMWLRAQEVRDGRAMLDVIVVGCLRLLILEVVA